MIYSIVIVLDDAEVSAAAGEALKCAGHHVSAFNDPIAALDALPLLNRVDVLITRLLFPGRLPHGVSLANMVRVRHRNLRVIFLASHEVSFHAADQGIVLIFPVAPQVVLAAVGRLHEQAAMWDW